MISTQMHLPFGMNEMQMFTGLLHVQDGKLIWGQKMEEKSQRLPCVKDCNILLSYSGDRFLNMTRKFWKIFFWLPQKIVLLNPDEPKPTLCIVKEQPVLPFIAKHF